MNGIAPARFPVLALLLIAAAPLSADSPVIHFDLPPTVLATPTSPDGSHGDVVQCEFRLSSLIAAPDSPKIDQWLIVCQPRDQQLMIVDYRPRTDAQSDIEGAIQVKSTKESTMSMGLSLDGHYSVARGNIGADKGNKNTNSRQYNLSAPQKAVTASGTINRGRGVYFKFRRSARQILEGEKTFQLVLRVPAGWRGSLIDISIVAQSERNTFGGLDRQVKTMGQSSFVVAACREGDSDALQIARRLSVAEQSLRTLISQQAVRHSSNSLSGLLRKVAVRLDLQDPDMDTRWIMRLLAGEADPYIDEEIRRLPMKVRLGVLDYCEIREEFQRLSETTSSEQDTNRVAANLRPTHGTAN